MKGKSLKDMYIAHDGQGFVDQFDDEVLQLFQIKLAKLIWAKLN